MIFIEPESAYQARTASGPQATGNELRGVVSIRARKLWEHMRQYRGAPVGLWKVIAELVRAEGLASRDDARAGAVYNWIGFRELRRAGLLYRHFGLIATQDFAYTPKRKRVKIVSHPVRRNASETDVSNDSATPVTPKVVTSHPVQNQALAPRTATHPAPAKTECARPTVEQISAAAGLIAMQPRRRKKKWTGSINGQRIRRWSLFKLPTGETARAVLIVRGVAYFWFDNPERFLESYPTSEVRRIKNPAAVLLGHLKRGKRETPSELKRSTARANGSMPCRPGKRRGRPRKKALAA